MGARYSELWVKAKDAASAAALAAEQRRPHRSPAGPAPAPGAWARLWQEDFDSEAFTRLDRRLCDEELAELGDLIYLAMYDGPAGELCGTFAYEHVVDGRVTRALVYAPGEDEWKRWLRVDGAPEPWEAPLLEASADEVLDAWREDREGMELPEPTPAEEAGARAACLRFTRDQQLPRLSEYELVRAVRDAFGLVIPPG